MKTKAKRYLYTRVALNKATEAVTQGMPISIASTKFGIPRTTLHDKIVKKYPDKKPGPQRILSEEEEKNLVEWILHMSNSGHRVTKDQIISSVEILVKQSQRKNSFVNNRPGHTWYNGFLHRHSELNERVIENISLPDESVDENTIRNWFNDVQNYLERNGLTNIDASRVFNISETSLPLYSKNKVLKGVKRRCNTVDNNTDEYLTVLLTGNAAGKLAIPFILFPYQRIPVCIYNKMPEDFAYGKSENGWMTAENFYEYIVNFFYPWIIENNILLPIILFVDSYSAYLTKALSDFCLMYQVKIITLPPHTTYLTQPMDTVVFTQLKTSWDKAVVNYKYEQNRLSVSKQDVGDLLRKVFSEMNLSKMLKNGFQICGLHPFSPNALDYTKIIGQTEHVASKNDTCKIKRNSENCSNLLEQLNSIISATISIDTLKHFESVKDFEKWPGKSEDENLFYVWKAIYKSTQAQISQKSSKLSLKQPTTIRQYMVPEDQANNAHDDPEIIEIVQDIKNEQVIIKYEEIL